MWFLWFLCIYLAGFELRNLPDLDYLKDTELLKCLNFERLCDVYKFYNVILILLTSYPYQIKKERF